MTESASVEHLPGMNEIDLKWSTILGFAAGVLALVPACDVGSKSVGMETEGTGDDGADGLPTGGADDDDGPTTDPSATSGVDDGGSSAGEGTTEGDTSGSGSEGGECGEPPPIDLAECVACNPSTGSYDNTLCLTDCTGVACGEPCLSCPEGEPGCLTSEHVGMCDSAGQCQVPGGPDLCMLALGPGFEDELTEQSGCADLVLFANDAADMLGLVLVVDGGLVADVVDSGNPMTTELDATDPSVDLRVETGISVTELVCNDAVNMKPVIDETWRPTAGTITIDLTPDGNGNALADVTLTDVTIERQMPPGGAGPITIPTYAFTNVVVGWLPG